MKQKSKTEKASVRTHRDRKFENFQIRGEYQRETLRVRDRDREREREIKNKDMKVSLPFNWDLVER